MTGSTMQNVWCGTRTDHSPYNMYGGQPAEIFFLDTFYSPMRNTEYPSCRGAGEPQGYNYEENRTLAPRVGEPGRAVHCLSEHVSVYLQIGLLSEGITGDHIGITLFRGDHRGSHERFHIYRQTYQPSGQRGSHQSVIR